MRKFSLDWDRNFDNLNLTYVSSILGSFLLYTYNLRQMADYEGSFDSRIGIQTICQLCYFTDLFATIVSDFTNKKLKTQKKSKIEKINSMCVNDIVPGYSSINLEKSVLYSIGGILCNAKINTLDTTRIFLKNPAYSPMIVNGKLFSPQDGMCIALEREIPLIPIKLRVLISDSGIIWLDIIERDTEPSREKDLIGRINSTSLEKFIVQHVLQIEILPSVGDFDLIYLGNMNLYEDYDRSLFQYIEDSFPTNMIKWNIHKRIQKKIIEYMPSSEYKLNDIPSIWVYENEDLENIERSINRRMMRTSDGKNPVIAIIYLLITIGSSQQEQIKEQIKSYSKEKSDANIIVNFVQNDFLNNIMSGDNGLFLSEVDKIANKIVIDIQNAEMEYSKEQVAATKE
jgi:hypothetical protein